MSLFGTSPPGESPADSTSRNLFDDDAPKSSSLFDDDDDAPSPWEAPSPRRPRANTRSLLRPSDVPSSYNEVFDRVLEEDHSGGLGRIGSAGVGRVFAAGRVSAERREEILGIVGAGEAMGRNEFNVLLALVGLVQEGGKVSLEAVEDRRAGKLLCSLRLRPFLSSCARDAFSAGARLQGPRSRWRWAHAAGHLGNCPDWPAPSPMELGCSSLAGPGCLRRD